MKSKLAFTLLAVALTGFTVTGCGPSQPELGQIEGILTIDGEPVKNGSIEFIPIGGGRPSLALTNAEGKYEAFYLPNVPGALTGKHRIRFEIAKGKPGDPGLVRPKKNGKRPQGEVKLEPSEIEVVSGENEINFQLVEAS
ncbi:carboxypeptidase regulatory-like domain-containing protein [Roseiconus lacunae]|uniref:Carboxypeptidase regulatory-like domain-containing protein n=1 Tax=Roseiconus lacunae TaxID=2605694 RepID=A0ABT7PIP2_9BACT|nr:carboxypeptidase regulatory-like domain-containing protein [Roseiconus lacunae]MDM4016365.1 carboxypeptidase regulatory-like domain-containing protein [Roseiconus lacunae]